MQLLAGFEVPSQVLGDFVQEITERGLIASITGTKDREIQVVTLPYEKADEADVNELDEYLGNLISDMDNEPDEEEEEGEDQ